MATVNGPPSSESLTGSTGDDLISGLRGDDTRVDGLVTDRLNGDGGADQYFLKRALDGAANIDAFADLESGVDAVALSVSILTTLPDSLGQKVGISSNLTYNALTRVLACASDGNGAHAPLTSANIGTQTHPTSLAQDFMVIS